MLVGVPKRVNGPDYRPYRVIRSRCTIVAKTQLRVTVCRVDSITSNADADRALGPWGPLTLPAVRQFPAPGECQLWSAPTTDVPGYLDLLDPGEQVRAERCKAANARAIFVASRAAQRLTLGWYLGRPPEQVQISRDCKLCAK